MNPLNPGSALIASGNFVMEVKQYFRNADQFVIPIGEGRCKLSSTEQYILNSKYVNINGTECIREQMYALPDIDENSTIPLNFYFRKRNPDEEQRLI